MVSKSINVGRREIIGSLIVGQKNRISAGRTIYKSGPLHLMSVNPQNELEGMLGAQMIATHTAAMECFKRAMIASVSLELRDRELNQANKLVRSYAVLLESLQRYRGKGESRQKVTVEHVHIHDGAQAIVGNIEPRK